MTREVSVALGQALVALFRRLQVRAPLAERWLRESLRRLASGTRKRIGPGLAASPRAELRSRWLLRSSFRRICHARQWLSVPARARSFTVLGVGGRDPLAVSEAVQGTPATGTVADERALDELVVKAETVEVGGAPSLK